MTRTYSLIILLTLISFTDSRACDEPPTGDELFCLDSYPSLNSVVRVKYDNEWIPICATVWPKSAADSVCMRIYGSDAKSTQFESVSDGNTKLAYVNWECMGKATCKSCRNCINQSSCNMIAEVECYDIRLSYKTDNREGMLKKYVNGQWGSVCPLTWDIPEADVACNQLYSCPAKAALTQVKYGSRNVSESPVNVFYYVCTGQEASLDECNVALAEQGTKSCKMNDHRRAGITCRSNCTRPISADNILVYPDRDDYEPFEKVKISCASGYQSEAGDGEKTLTCLRNCSWTGQTLECKPVCDPPVGVRNATFLPEQDFYFVGATVTYTCHERFGLEGSSVLTCGVNQKWNPRLPECIDNIKARQKKVGEDYTLGPFPAIVASIVMGSALAIALIFFVVLVVRRANEGLIEYEESVDETMSQREEESEMGEMKELQ